ncbi:polysaccharide biosynthesis/export family protein [Hymenobacter mucosus]|uniref:Polysaccharide export outer membrane protein n=1 Tax=Hymenobacter mucosus TaxID=1411120 RepID=A0A238ZA62_9BACT|nr:polysaccharide biosynthesis/export family protein [Hymenobacter mucosus]SNR79614.1 polysaccharide export outer membrane protein [Hymenobacter mucosus]
MKRLVLPGLLLWLCLLTSCTQNLFQSASKTEYKKLTLDPDYQYQIRKDDKLSVSVWDHEELSVGSIYSIYNSNEIYGKWLLVDATGKVSLPKVGAFQVQGLTVPEAEANLKQVLSQWIVNPQVNIKVLNKEITVLGEVNTPGTQLLEKERNTLVEVLGRAGDFSVHADKEHVKVLRANGSDVRELEVDLTQLDHFDLNNIVVLPGDVVYIPARNGKQFDKKSGTALAVASSITAIIVLTRLVFAL